MDDQRLERIEQKLDRINEQFNLYQKDVCTRISLLEYQFKEQKKMNNEQNKELKPLSNVRWLFIQIPSIVAVVASLIAIIKVFGKIP